MPDFTDHVPRGDLRELLRVPLIARLVDEILSPECRLCPRFRFREPPPDNVIPFPAGASPRR